MPVTTNAYGLTADYIITLTVTDRNGNTDPDTVDLTVDP